MPNAPIATMSGTLEPLNETELDEITGGAEVITFGYHDDADNLIGFGVQVQVGNNYTTLGAWVDGSGPHLTFTNQTLAPPSR